MGGRRDACHLCEELSQFSSRGSLTVFLLPALIQAQVERERVNGVLKKMTEKDENEARLKNRALDHCVFSKTQN